MRAVAVQPEDLSDWFELLEWHFQSFCRDGSLDPNDLWNDCMCEKRQLWVLMEENDIMVAVLTGICPDNHKTCDVTHAAGKNMRSWAHLWPALEHWAREIGCTRIRATARPGWERFLPLKKTHVVLEGYL